VSSLALLAGALPQDARIGAELENLSSLLELVRWTGVVASVFVVAAAWLLLRIVDGMVENLAKALAPQRMLLQKLRAGFHFVTYLGTGAAVLLLSFNLTQPVVAVLGGTAAVAFGFALKDLAASLVAGVTIMVDQPFQVGDRVRFEDQYGDIVSIGLRSVRLRTLDDSMITIPNGRFMDGCVSSGNFGELDMQVEIAFYIGADQDGRKAVELAREAVVVSRYVYLAKPVDVVLKQTIVDSYVAIQLKVKAYVLDTTLEKAFETDVTLRVLDVFKQHGIQPPALLHRSAEGTPVETTSTARSLR
jgi:small-conductance mechanosensitive channel